MNSLSTKPNVLFSVFMRNWNVNLVKLTNLARNVYYRRMIVALTVITHNDGSSNWIVCGRHHRDDGPACITDAVKLWSKHGLHHRVDGPAIEYANGDVYNGQWKNDMKEGIGEMKTLKGVAKDDWLSFVNNDTVAHSIPR